MMTFCLLVCLILTLQRVEGIASSTVDVSDANNTDVVSTVSSETIWRTSVTERPGNSARTTAGKEEPQEQQDQCAWWCNQFYGIIVLASAGTILLASIIVCMVSCCVWKRIKCTKQDMKDKELDMLGPRAAPDSGRSLPVQEEPPAMKDEGVSDIENCSMNSEPPKKETPQHTEDQSADGPAFPLPPPENIPMLP